VLCGGPATGTLYNGRDHIRPRSSFNRLQFHARNASATRTPAPAHLSANFRRNSDRLGSKSGDFSTSSDAVQQSCRDSSAPVPARFCTSPTHFGSPSGRRQHMFQLATAAVPVHVSTCFGMQQHRFRWEQHWSRFDQQLFQQASIPVPVHDSSRSDP
jgi:hypothetical protein